MPDNHYLDPKLAELYDIDSGWSEDRDFYLSLAGNEPKKSILDLGCGTGLICNAYAARGHRVVGVDPSQAMLDIAATKSHANFIDWVQASAQTFKSATLFDLIIMTGHAFQVLLSDDDICAAFSTIRAHLKSDGLAVFESRNPRIDWTSKWNYSLMLDLPNGQVRETRRLLEWQRNKMSFELQYDFLDETLVSLSELRFAENEEIAALLSASGLQLNALLGDWSGGEFDDERSEEMIFVVGRGGVG